MEGTFKNGGYYKIDVHPEFSLLAFNTLEYNKKQEQSEIGREAADQMDWLEQNMSDTTKKFLIFEHIYAGGRGKQNT